jgi:hypothetical protein
VGEEDQYQRRQFNNPAPGQLELKVARESDPSRRLGDQEIEDADLARILRELPEQERRIIEDHYLRQVPIEDLVTQLKKGKTPREQVRRRLYQLLHRFRTRVRREHPLTARGLDAALERLEHVAEDRGIAPELLADLRQERQAREFDQALLADMFLLLLVTRLRRRAVRASDDEAARICLEDGLFRLRLRTGAADLRGLVRNQMKSVEERLRATEVYLTQRVASQLDRLTSKELVAVGRQLRRIGAWLASTHKRGVDALADLVLELRLRAGGPDYDTARREVRDRLLTLLGEASERGRARELLRQMEGDARWRQAFKLLLRLQRARRPVEAGQVVNWLRRIAGASGQG